MMEEILLLRDGLQGKEGSLIGILRLVGKMEKFEQSSSLDIRSHPFVPFTDVR